MRGLGLWGKGLPVTIASKGRRVRFSTSSFERNPTRPNFSSLRRFDNICCTVKISWSFRLISKKVVTNFTSQGLKTWHKSPTSWSHFLNNKNWHSQIHIRKFILNKTLHYGILFIMILDIMMSHKFNDLIISIEKNHGLVILFSEIKLRLKSSRYRQ